MPCGVTRSKEGYPDNKVQWANMGPIWDRQDPGEPHVGPMNLAIWEGLVSFESQINTFSLRNEGTMLKVNDGNTHISVTMFCW